MCTRLSWPIWGGLVRPVGGAGDDFGVGVLGFWSPRLPGLAKLGGVLSVVSASATSLRSPGGGRHRARVGTSAKAVQGLSRCG
jgi:hypothetical protein